MLEYRWPFAPGGTFFFTVVTQDRQPILCGELARPLLRAAIAAMWMERAFDLLAMVLLEHHMHALWELPAEVSDFSSHWAAIKAGFTRAFLLADGVGTTVTADRAVHRGRSVWQQLCYHHLIRDENDLSRHLDYVHYKPVKHGVAKCPHGYRYSTFQKRVERKAYEKSWCCGCDGSVTSLPDFGWADGIGMESLWG